MFEYSHLPFEDRLGIWHLKIGALHSKTQLNECKAPIFSFIIPFMPYINSKLT